MSDLHARIGHRGLKRPEFALRHLVGEFTITNSCAIFDGPSLQLVSLIDAPDVAILHGFSEYKFGFIRLASVRAPNDVAERAALQTRCDWHRTALAVPFTRNNVLHALYHAVPSFEHPAGLINQRGPGPIFLPLFSHTTGIGRKTSFDPATWHAWELSVRALTRAPADAIASATSRLLRAPCSCFSTISGSTAPFAPAAPASAPRLRQWARAVLRNAPVPHASNLASTAASRSNHHEGITLYVRRLAATRTLTNEPELLSALRPTDRVHAVDLESRALADQLNLVAGAVGLVAVHGQAFGFLPFLAAHLRGGRGAASAVEILPPPPFVPRGCGRNDCARKMPFYHLCKSAGTQTRGYPAAASSVEQCSSPSRATDESLSAALGVEHAQIIASLAPPCNAHALRGKRVESYLGCNLTVAPAKFVRAIRLMRSQRLVAVLVDEHNTQ